MQKQIFKRLVAFFLIGVFAMLGNSKARAYGFPDYLPDGSHPRIILNSEELSRLVQKRDNAAAEWIALRNWCDSHINDTGYDTQPTELGYGGVIAYGLANWNGNNYFGYRMSGFAEHLQNYALAYQVLKQPGSGQDLAKAASYAARARTLLVDGIANGLRVGEEENGLRALRVSDLADVSVNNSEVTALAATSENLPGQVSTIGYKLGYSSRFLNAVPLAYDWIYDTLSQQDKDILASMMLRWYDWIQGVRSTYNNGVLINGIRYYEDFGGTADSTHINPSGGQIVQGSDFGKIYSNFGSGHESLMLLIPVALYGYNADIPNYFSQTKSRLGTNVINVLESDLGQSGGESVEGWNYGSGFQYLLPSLFGYYVATGDPNVSSMQWSSALVDAMVHRLAPNFLDVPYWGYWTGTPLGVNRQSFALPFVGVLQRLSPSGNLSKVGQYLLANAPWSDSASLYDSMLWKRSDVAQESPAILPLTYLAKGLGMFSSRSSWNDNNAITLMATLKGVGAQANHEGYSQGHISVSRGTDRLLAHSNAAGDSPAAVSFDTIVFNSANPHANNPALTTPAIDRKENNSEYAYVSADITNAYKRQWNTDKALLFRRTILHVLPNYIIVYDVTRSNTAVGNLKDWYTNYIADPVIDDANKTISAVVGSSKIFTKTLFPLSGNFTKSNPYTNSYRVKFTPAVTQEYDQFLHVIEATGTSDSQTPTTLIEGTGGRGALIENSSENVIVMFTADQNAADITSLAYSANTTMQSRHIITNLIPNQNYKIIIDSQFPTQQKASSAGIIEFQNPSSGDHSYQISNAPLDMVAPAAPSSILVF